MVRDNLSIYYVILTFLKLNEMDGYLYSSDNIKLYIG